MPDADHSKWTPLQFIADLLLTWSEGRERPTNGSLVLQKVTRDQAGSYTCEASNVEGDEVSKPVGITIMCK